MNFIFLTRVISAIATLLHTIISLFSSVTQNTAVLTCNGFATFAALYVYHCRFIILFAFVGFFLHVLATAFFLFSGPWKRMWILVQW